MLIGEGAFAEVFTIDGENLVKKKLKKSSNQIQDKENKDRFRREINLLRQFDNPSIIKVVDYDIIG